MALDRINIGLGPRLGAAPTATSGFSFLPKQKLTKDQYLSQYVDFSKQTLDFDSLGSTGISVDAPEVGADIDPAASPESSGDDEDNAVQNILKGPLTSLGGGKFEEGESNVKYGAEALYQMGDVGTAYQGKYSSYSDYLKGEGMADRVNIVENLYEPLADKNKGFKDVDFGKALSNEVQEGIETAKNLPGEVGSDFEKLKTADGRKQLAEQYGPKAMGQLMGAVGGPMGMLTAGLMSGTTVQNAFGEASFRPSGPLGAVADMVHSRQYKDIQEIRAAQSGQGSYDISTGRYLEDYTKGDTGFAIKFGNHGITRRPGGGYIGNMQGMSFNQVKELEALTKGYIPSTYSFDTSKTEGAFGRQLNQTVEESGGVFSDPNNRLKGYYTAEGKYYTPGVGVSLYGNKADLVRLANSYGFKEAEMNSILKDARAGKGTMADLIKAEQDRRAAAAAKAERERKAKEAAAAAERARQENIRRNQEAGQAYLARDDVFYGGEDDGGGPSFSSSGPSAESAFDNVNDNEGLDPDDYAAGGTVGMAAGGAMAANMNSGFIGAPPSQVPEEKTVADDQKTAYPEGTFIINAAAVEFAGEKDIVKMLNDAQKEAVRRGIVLDNAEKGAKLIDVAVSQGEVKVAPYLAKIIGYDRLNKINNRGKPEVAERQQEAAQGGFLDRPGYASGDMVTVYRGEPIDPAKAEMTHNYGYDKENVGKFHSPSIDKARAFAKSAGPGNQQILSRKVTIDQLFDGVEEAWKVGAQKKTEYFGKMPKKELDKNIKFIREMQKAYQKGERSIESMAMFLQEQVFHDDKSKVNFIETFKNDPKSAGKLAGRAISKVATKATPPLAILEMIGTVFAPKTMGDGTLQGNESFLEMD